MKDVKFFDPVLRRTIGFGELVDGQVKLSRNIPRRATVELIPDPACPLLMLPANGAVDQETEGLPFQWGAVPGGTAYRVYLSVDGGPFELAAESETDTALIDVGVAGADVAWYVNAVIAGAEQNCSGLTYSFSTIAPQLVEVSFVEAAYAASPGTTLQIGVQRTGSFAAATSVDVSFQSGTAILGTDFTATNPTTVSWAPGESDPVLVDVPIAAQQLTRLATYKPGTGILDNVETLIAEGGYLYVGNLSAPFVVIDVADPNAPVQVGTLSFPSFGGDALIRGMVKDGNYIYATSEGGSFGGAILVIDVTNPAAPVEAAILDPGTSAYSGPHGILKRGDYLYVAIGGQDAIAVIDVSDPLTPTEVGYTRGAVPGTTLTNCRGIALVGDYLLVCLVTRDLIVVVDVANPALPTVVTEFAGPVPGTSLNGAVDIEVRDGVAFVACADQDSIAAIDVSNPAAPVWISEFRGAVPGTTFNDPEALMFQGDELWMICDPAVATPTLYRIDVSNPAAMSTIGSVSLAGSGITGGLGFADLDADGKHVYVAMGSNDAIVPVSIRAGTFTAALTNPVGPAVTIVAPDETTVTIA